MHTLTLDFTLFESELPHIIAIIVVLAVTLELSLDACSCLRKLVELFLNSKIKLKHDLFLKLKVLRCLILLRHLLTNSTHIIPAVPLRIVCLREEDFLDGLSEGASK